MTVLSLRFCARAFSSCGEWGPLFIAVRRPLTVAASLVVEHRLQTRRLSNCGSRAQLLRGMWDLPRPGHEPVSPALAGRFSTTVPPGKPQMGIFLTSLLEYNCFTMVCQFLLYNKVNQLYIYIYPHISSPLRFPPSHPPYPTPLGSHKALSWSPCAMRLLPTSYLFYVW